MSLTGCRRHCWPWWHVRPDQLIAQAHALAPGLWRAHEVSHNVIIITEAILCQSKQSNFVWMEGKLLAINCPSACILMHASGSRTYNNARTGVRVDNSELSNNAWETFYAACQRRPNAQGKCSACTNILSLMLMHKTDVLIQGVGLCCNA